MFPLKIIHHTKNWKDLKLNDKRTTNTQRTVLLELFEKYFQAAMIKML